MPNPKWPTIIPISEAIGQFLSPNPSETTRLDFTDFFQRFRHSPDAHPSYKHLFNTQQRLAKLLIEHPAMMPNLQQTFSTPANSKNKVYSMWDFILRSFQILAAQVDPRNPESSPMFVDIMLRSVQAKELTIDKTNKKLNTMNASVGYKDDDGVEFTDEIKQLAATLTDLPNGCAGCGKEKREDGRALLVCSKCKGQTYCGTECQNTYWKTHKREGEAVNAAA